MKSIKVFNLNNRACWIIFIVALVILSSFMIATLATLQWVKLNPKSDTRYKFEGGLLILTDGLDAIDNPFDPFNSTIDIADNSFITIGCSSEFLLSLWDKNTTDEAVWNFYKSWQKLFEDLWLAGGFFLVFEVQSLVCIVIVIVTLVLIFKERYYFNLNLCAAICLWISHVIAIIGWIGLLDTTFSEDCEELNDEDMPPTICATTGPRLGIIVLILLPFIMIPYFVVFAYFRKKVLMTQANELNVSAEVINSTHMAEVMNSEQKAEVIAKGKTVEYNG